MSPFKSVPLFAEGDRVIVPASGRTATVVKAPATKRLQHHNYVKVRWDNPVFGVTESRIAPTIMELIAEG